MLYQSLAARLGTRATTAQRIAAYLLPMAIGFSLLALPAGCSRLSTRRTPLVPGELPTADQVVALLNQNADRAEGLIAKDLDISSNQVLVPLDGRLALEKPRHFRLIATTPATKITVADIGSNDEEFWFYMSQPTQRASLIHCSYADYGRVQGRIPVQPDWIFDSIGFLPLPSDRSHIVRPGKRGTVELVSPTLTPQGQPASLVTAVQMDQGWIVERRLEVAGRPKPIATATLSHHQRDPVYGVVYPSSMSITWPDENLEITIRMRGVEINPRFDPYQAQALWRLPREQYVVEAGAEEIDLGAAARSSRVPARPSARLGTGPNGRTRVEPVESW